MSELGQSRPTALQCSLLSRCAFACLADFSTAFEQRPWIVPIQSGNRSV